MQNVNISQAVLYAHCMFELGMFVFDAHTSSLTRRIIYDSFIGQNLNYMLISELVILDWNLTWTQKKLATHDMAQRKTMW